MANRFHKPDGEATLPKSGAHAQYFVPYHRHLAAHASGF
jgi:hypothetical protein